MSLAGWVGIIVAIIVAVSSARTEAQAPTTLRVERFGSESGRTVVFIPGLSTPGEVWADTVAAFGSEVDAHVVTLAGFGAVPAVDRGEAGVLGRAVTDLVAWLDQAEVEDAVLVGHSMGAQIALQVAARQPGRVAAVVVVDSAPFFARLFNPVITTEQAAAYATSMSGQMRAASREQFLAFARQGLAVQSISEAGQARVMAWMEQADQGVVAAAMGEVMGTDFSPVLNEVNVPVTVLIAWSEGAPMSAEALESVYARQYDALADFRLHRIDGARHFIMLDQPEAFRSGLASVINTPLEGE